MNTYIVCCGTHGRCVIVGERETDPESGKPCRLTNARMILCWSSETGGLLGLAAKGPREGCRITAAVGVTETSPVTEWCSVSETAAQEIAKWPVA